MGALSSQPQQRVALVQALVAEPKVLLPDRPLSNLDAKLRGEMEIKIHQARTQNGGGDLHGGKSAAMSRLVDAGCGFETDKPCATKLNAVLDAVSISI